MHSMRCLEDTCIHTRHSAMNSMDISFTCISFFCICIVCISIVRRGFHSQQACQHAERRYNWLRKRLRAREEVWAIFPEAWRVPQLLCLMFCQVSHAASTTHMWCLPIHCAPMSNESPLQSSSLHHDALSMTIFSLLEALVLTPHCLN